MNHPYEEKLRRFVEDEIMYQAVRTILEEKFNMNGIEYNPESDNAVLGQTLRAHMEGRNLLNEGFKELNKFRQDNTPKEGQKVNPGL